MRRVRIVVSAPSLALWLENRPLKLKPKATLWISLSNKSKHKSLNYSSACALLKRACKESCNQEKVNPHAFRHARATHLASLLTEAQMKEYFGWVQASKMAGVYVHLSGIDVDNAILELHGLVKNESMEENVLKVKVCTKCKEKNDPISKFCRRC
jgi:integrase